MKLGEWLTQAESDFRVAGVDAPRTDALVLLERVLKRDRTWILSHLDTEISAEDASVLRPLLNRRVEREPLAYIVGYKEFYGLRFKVTPDVLIPRPETEALVEYVAEHAPQHGAALDVGTGSGAIAVAVKHERPDLTVDATDVSEKVLKVAQHNSGQNKTNINFINTNLLNYITKKYDIIAANLPYVPAKTTLQPELSHEPSLALHSGAQGLDHYEQLLAAAADVLLPSGTMIIEHDPDQLIDLQAIAIKTNWQIRKHTEFTSVLRLTD